MCINMYGTVYLSSKGHTKVRKLSYELLNNIRDLLYCLSEKYNMQL